jgi:thiamine-monophosphate kinase
MKNDCTDIEMNFLQTIAGAFRHHLLQENALNEADAEIINWKDQHPDYLVFKTDGIHEEIREKLYEDPYLVGWMGVTVTMSDIAAVGADPFGIMVSLQLPQDSPQCWIRRFQQGVQDACTRYGISVLGGDTSLDRLVSVNTTGVATLTNHKPLMRKPVQPGELLYASGPLGDGAAYVYSRLVNKAISVHYFPTARLKEKNVIRQFATACIDTSDGFFPALSVLTTLNSIGLNITRPVNSLLSQDAIKVSGWEGVPDWFFLAGPHGEYELLFSIPPAKRQAFEAACQKEGWKPLLIGEVTDTKQIRFTTREISVMCPAPAIANLWHQSGGSPCNYFRMLMEKDQQWLTHKNAVYAYQE